MEKISKEQGIKQMAIGVNLCAVIGIVIIAFIIAH